MSWPKIPAEGATAHQGATRRRKERASRADEAGSRHTLPLPRLIGQISGEREPRRGRLDGVAAQVDIINRPTAIGSRQDRSQRLTRSREEFRLTRAGDEKKKRPGEHLQPLCDITG